MKRVDALLAINDNEGAGFHLQQAAEKYRKGYWLGRGWQLKRTHDLDDLIDDALQFDAHFETFRKTPFHWLRVHRANKWMPQLKRSKK